LLRLFRFGIIFTRRIARWTGAVNIVKVEYIIVGVSILVVVLMGAFSMRVAEGRLNPDFQTLDRALWFSVMTVIGGEPIGGYPKTSLGRFITATLMMGGLTVFAIFTGTISAVMVNSLKNLKFRPMEIDEIDNHVVLCGWNRAGHLIIDELLHDERFKHVVVISEDEATGKHPIFQKYVEQVFVLTGDYTRVDVLHDAGVERASYAMLLADSSKEGRSSQDRDARTVLAAMLIEKLNKNIYTVVQLLNRDNETSLRQVGVEEIIVSDEYVGNIMATVAKNRGIVSMLDELLTAKHGDQFFKCAVPEEMVGKTVAEVIMDLKVVYDATLIGVDLGSGGSLAETMCVNPPGSLKLEATHQIIIAGSRPI
jgi:voltage-gated potassium channel